MPDVKIVAGGPPNDSLLLVNTDQVTIGGDGSVERPLHTLSGGSAGVDVESDGTPLANNPHATLNVTGAGATVVDSGGGVATLNVPGGITVEEGGTPIENNPHATLNVTGAGASVADSGGGVATLNVPGGVTLQEEGAPIGGNPHSTLNFIGTGISVSDIGGGVADVFVGGTAATLQFGAQTTVAAQFLPPGYSLATTVTEIALASPVAGSAIFATFRINGGAQPVAITYTIRVNGAIVLTKTLPIGTVTSNAFQATPVSIGDTISVAVDTAVTNLDTTVVMQIQNLST